MTFGLRRSQPACRPHPASLPVRVPAVEGLLRASFSFTSRLRPALRYLAGAVIGSGWLLSSNRILPMSGTLGRTISSPAGQALQRVQSPARRPHPRPTPLPTAEPTRAFCAIQAGRTNTVPQPPAARPKMASRHRSAFRISGCPAGSFLRKISSASSISFKAASRSRKR